MVWSLIKIIFFVVLVTIMTFATTYVIEAGGTITINIAATEFTLTPLAGLVAVLIILGIGWIAFRLAGLAVATFRFFNGDETAISRYFDRNRERRGFEALADGFMALASGEGRLALAKAAKAEKYLARPDLTLLISAQAAELSGETKRAQGYYKKLLADDRTRFVAVQGILKQKLADGDTDTALKLAEKAFALRPKHEKTLDVLFSLQSEKQDWSGARETLGAKLKTRALTKDVHTRRDAVLALAQARELIENGDMEKGRLAALQANRLSPDLVPAAVLAAEMHVLNNTPKSAVKVIRKAWASTPHPDLAAAFAEIAPDETPTERLARFQPLLKTNADDPETVMLKAELLIAAEDFPAAHDAVASVVESAPTTRSLTIMAAAERGQGAPDNVVRGWLTKALDASRGPRWVCDSCGTVHAAWDPVCDHCQHFDTLTWKTPKNRSEIARNTADMLPLIVGTSEDNAKSGPEELPDATANPQPDPVTAPETEDDLDGLAGDIRVIPDIYGRKPAEES